MAEADAESEILSICSGLNRYYISLKKKYENKFSDHCRENGIYDDLLEQELEIEPKESVLVDFDVDNFPLSEEYKHLDQNEDEKKKRIFELITKIRENPDISFGKKSVKCMYTIITTLIITTPIITTPIILKRTDKFRVNIVYNYNYTVDQEFFDLDTKHLEKAKQNYQQQTPILWQKGIDIDQSLQSILAIGCKNEYPYLLNLIDDYNRSRIAAINKSFSITNWTANHKHFKHLAQMNLSVNQDWDVQSVQSAVQLNIIFHPYLYLNINNNNNNRSFENRCGPVQLNSIWRINDSIQQFAQYINAVTDFIDSLVKFNGKNETFPFILEVLYSTGKLKVDQTDFNFNTEEKEQQQKAVFKVNLPEIEEEDDSSDEDGDDNKCNNSEKKPQIGHKDAALKYVDIGDIKCRLEGNQLPYIKYSAHPKDEFTGQTLKRMFGTFVDKYNLKGGNGKHPYPYRQRFILLIDRRKTRNKQTTEFDQVFLYIPPAGKNTRDIPDKAVPEWGFNAARTCWIPNIGYNQKQVTGPTDYGKEAKKLINNNVNNDDETAEMKVEGNNNICSVDDKYTGLLTLSFQVHDVNEIKLYL